MDAAHPRAVRLRRAPRRHRDCHRRRPRRRDLEPPPLHRPSRLRLQHPLADAGGRTGHHSHRDEYRVARDHVPLPRPSRPVLCPAPAARGAELCARLRHHGSARVRGHPAARPARRLRLGVRRRLLVSRDPLRRRRDARALARALPLRLPARPCRLRGAVLLSLRGEPHPRTGAAAELSAHRGAHGASRHRGGRGAGPSWRL